MTELPLLDRLRAVRRGGSLIGSISDSERPKNLAEAYAIAGALQEADAEFGGYKIGATSDRGRQLLGLSAPFYGRLPKDSLTRSPATIRLAGRTLALEAEIGLQMAVGLPARGIPYSRGQVAAAVRRVLPLIELNRPSFVAPFAVGGLCLIADNGVTAGAVTGYPGSIGLDSVSLCQVELRADGIGSVRGAAAAAPDDPLSSLAWLANTLNDAGLELRAGDIIATGAMTPPLEVDREASVTADFGSLGIVQLSLL